MSSGDENGKNRAFCYNNKMTVANKKLKIIDLFSGCGGLSYGFEQAGFEVVLAIDNWEDSLKTFAKNHPHSKTCLASLGEYPVSKLCKDNGLSKGKIDVVVGGPPCQGFSIAGKRDKNDPRNSLYKSFVDMVSYLKPRAFILENVPNLVSMGGGAIKEQIIKDFEKLGYKVSYKILLAADYGVPQNRRRVVFVGLLNGKNFEFPAETHGGKKSGYVTAYDAISDLSEKSAENGTPYTSKPLSGYQLLMRKKSKAIYNHQATEHSEQTKKIISLVPDGGNYKNLPLKLQDTRKVNIAWTRLNSKKPSFTIDTGHNHHFHYKYNRVPTVRESARLQSFPDNFVFLGNKTSQLKQVGNAVPPLLGRSIAIQLLKYI